MAKDLIGKTLAGYQITEKLGVGGMAVIYKAYQPSLDREIALKLLPPFYAEQDDTFVERFKREAKSIASLEHQNILPVIDSGVADDYFYMVMQYVRGGTLKELMLQRSLSLHRISLLMGQVSDALDYAHSRGVVHRDIKPSNVLMRSEEWAILTDFGLAKIVDNPMLTQSGHTVGTPAYMSPEQGSGAEVDARSDIYSLGVILYEMVVGQVPYLAETPMAVVVKHMTEPLPLPREKNPNIPEDLQRVILKALAKNPADRFQTAGEFSQALQIVAEGNPSWSSALIKAPVGNTAIHNDKTTLPPFPHDAETMIDRASNATAKPHKNWRLLTLLFATLAVLMIGVVITMTALEALEHSATVVTPTPRAPGLGPGGFKLIPLTEIEVGSFPLPPGPTDEVLNYKNPWEDGKRLFAEEQHGPARTAYYQALIENPARWGEFLAFVDDLYLGGDEYLAADYIHFGLMAIGPEMATPDDIDYAAFLFHENKQYGFAAGLNAYLIIADPYLESAYDPFYDDAARAGLQQEAFELLKRIEAENDDLPEIFFEIFADLAIDVGKQ